MAPPRQPLDPPQTTPVDAHALAAEGAGILLDVREREEFAAGHAPGALLLPLGALIRGEPLPATDGQTVLVLCRSGNRSQQAAAFLNGRGVAAVNVAGGMRAWALAGLPVISPDGRNGYVI